MNTPVKIILLGPPGSGKDTHAAILSATFGIPSISMGGMLREEIVRQTPDGARAAAAMQKGEMVPQEIVDRLLKAKLESESCAKGYILNGYTRAMHSLEKYLAMDQPTHVIHLMLSDDDVQDRLKVRGRHDDQAHIIEVRLVRYHDEEVKVADYWKNDPTVWYKEIWTNRVPIDITKDIIDFMHASMHMQNRFTK
jgi:adenylate kinase